MSQPLKEFARLKFLWLEQIAADAELPPQAARVAIRLAFHLNFETQLSRPGYRKIAADLGVNHETAIVTVRALIERGHLAIAIPGKAGRGSSNQYRLLLKAEEKVGPSGPLDPTEKVGPSEPLPKGEKVGIDPPKRSDTSDQNNYNNNPLPPFAEHLSAEGAPGADPRAAVSGAAGLAQDAAEFLAAMPHRPDHVPKPSKRILAGYLAARASGATRGELLAGADRCRRYHSRLYGDGPCSFAPSPVNFLRDRKWTAGWELPLKKRNPACGDDARRELLAEMRGMDPSKCKGRA